MWLWALPVAGGFLCLYVFGRHHQAAVLREWEMLLYPSSRRAVATLEEQTALDGTMAEFAYGSALKARDSYRFVEAVRLIDLAVGVIEEAVPHRLTRLRGMRVCCRMATAVLPLPPLRPRGFQLRRLATLVGIAALAHHLLVGTAERFVLRLHVLGWGFRLVFRAMGDSAQRLQRQPGAPSAWTTFKDALGDFRTLDREHVDAFRTLLASLAAEQRA